MCSEEQFDSLHADRGGRLPESEYGKILQEVKNLIDKRVSEVRLYYPLPSDLHVDYVNSDILNATVKRWDGKYYLGMYRGTPHLIADMFFKMLSVSKVMPGLGDSTAELESVGNLNACVLNSRDQEYTAFLKDAGNEFTPRDPVRQMAANIFSGIALDFLILHECGHIVRGHVNYIELLPGGTSLNEFVCLEEKDKALDFQTLEMDADSFAINRMFNNCAYNLDRLAELDEGVKPFFCHWDVITYNVCFSVYALFRLLRFKEYTIDKARLQTHPPVQVRMAFIVDNIIRILIERFGHGDIDSISDIITIATQDAELAFGTITPQDDAWQEFEKAFQPHVKNYKNDILLNWNNLRPQLEKHALGDLPPLVS